MLKDEEWGQWSDREIGRRCCVDGTTVGRIRTELSAAKPQMQAERKVERNGTTYVQNTENIGQRKPAALRVAEISALAADGNGGLCELLACEKFTFFGAVYA